MSLSLALGNALSGLNVSKQSLAVLSNNIANANTPDYSRKVSTQTSSIVDGAGSGAQVEEVVRKVDDYLANSVRRQTSSFGKANVLNEFAQRMQLLLGKPGNADSLDSAVTGFFNVIQTLADSPDRSSLQLNAVNSAVSLAKKISDLADDLQGLRLQADTEIQAAVKDVNTQLKQLQEINQAIGAAYYSGKDTADLLDKRDSLLKKLSENLDISYYTGAAGEAIVATNSGVALLDSARYELSYAAQASKDAFLSDQNQTSIAVYRVDDRGQRAGSSVELVSGGPSSQVVTGMVTGKIRGLLDMRDQRIPDILEQVDNLASHLRDSFNAVHNSGIAYPGANSYTGTRQLSPTEYSQWEGSVRIAVLGADGRPVASPYADEPNGLMPLTLDMGSLNTGQGAGKPSVQGIIDEINQYYRMPQNKASLGDLSNIRLASNTVSLSASGYLFNFDFDLENLAANAADMYITGLSARDDQGNALATPTSTIPSVALNGTGTFTTTEGLNTVTVAANAHGLHEGDVVYLGDPGTDINGIVSSQFNGFFTISNVTADSFQIVTTSPATSDGAVGVLSQTALPKYATAAAGALTRTGSNGTVTANFGASPAAQYYTVTANVAVRNADGTIKMGEVSYRVNNGAPNMLGQRYSATAVDGSAQIKTAGTTVAPVKAIMVDANGVELAMTSGKYLDSEAGFLKIVASDSTQVVAIDSLDSKQLGFPDNQPPRPGTDRGFSFYFELNNFFDSYLPTTTGDTVAGSAVNLSVQTRLRTNPSLISLGTLTPSPVSADPERPPAYTYERSAGDNSVVQRLAGLSTTRITFAAAGGLGAGVMDLNAYAGNILGYMASDAQFLQTDQGSQQIILEGFATRYSSVSGVNLDEELGNTIIYQNAYTASARIISVVKELFDALMQAA